MPARKTIRVEDVRAIANRMLDPQQAPGAGRESRRTTATMIETILMDTDNYKGFRYLDMENDETARYYF